MKYQDKQRLATLLAPLHAGERQKLCKRAGKMRKEAMSRGSHAPSLDEMILRLLEEKDSSETSSITSSLTGEVVGVALGRATVLVDGREVDIPLTPELAKSQQSAISVGDDVRLASDPERVIAVLPRRTELSRPDPGTPHRKRLLAANVDMAIIVASVSRPPLRLRLLDRALLAVAHGGIAPLMVITKVDLLAAGERNLELGRLQPYRDMAIPVIHCSSQTGEGLEEIRSALAGKTCVLMGHSGVGKSSLLNALDPSFGLRTDAVRGDGKGRHTTSASHLYRLPGEIRLIDTPGVREFGLWKMSSEDIRHYFADFTELAAECGFNDCTHTHEPNCGVKLAVREGTISRGRYDSYRRLVDDTGDDELTDSTSEEAFICTVCDAPVLLAGAGCEHRNHCPRCLWSRHLDDRPGDRAAGCGGKMEPVAVWVRKGGEWALVHRCCDCGAMRSNRIAADDNEILLLSLAVRPLAQPPFKLDAIMS